MAAIASRRPAWSVPAWVTGSAVAPLALGALVAFTVYLRTRDAGVGLWGDEGLSVGIADRPLTDIPSTLRLDGSPPLYYALLHFWMELVGRSEAQTHALSLVFAALAVPAAWWAARGVFGTRASWIAAVLAATNPFLTQYAQETRMYSLIVFLEILACGCFLRAFVLAGTGADPGGRARRRWAVACAVALAAMFYTHNWALFFAAGCGATWLAVLVLAPRAQRRELVLDGVIAFGGALLLLVPWLSTFAYQAAHTGAPWSQSPTVLDLLGVPGWLLGVRAQYILLLAAGVGALALWSGGGWRITPRGRGMSALLCVAVCTLLAAWASSQVSPAWAGRYLAVGLPPLLLASAAGLAHARRLGLVAAVIVAVIWARDEAPKHKSNVREVARAIAPSLRPGDLVVSTQPEEVPLLHYYLPKGLKYATLWGPVNDVGVTDWRDGMLRLRGTNAPRDLAPILDRLPHGRRIVLVTPVIHDMARWVAPWTSLIRVRSTEWRQFVSNDPRFTAVAVRPVVPEPKNNLWQATVLVKD